MLTVRSGVDAVIPVSLVNDVGVGLAPSAVNWSLYDENDVLLTGPTAAPGPYNATFTITVPAAQNIAAGNQVNAGRTLRVSATTPAGVFQFETNYLIRGTTRLQILKNSFVSLIQAEVFAASLPDIEGWNTATDDAKIQALAESYSRLIQFGYRVRFPLDSDPQQYISGWREQRVITPQMWPAMTTQRWLNDYTEQFRETISRAQVVEANSVLAADELDARRAKNIVMERVGESEIRFGSLAAPLDLGISKRTMKILMGYIELRYTLTRS
jgi:hypothetical protein